MTKIILSGCMGKMGKVVQNLADSDPRCSIVAGVDTAASGGSLFPVYANFADFCGLSNRTTDADVVVDFSVVEALPGVLEFCAANEIPAVLCTTGYSEEALASIQAASEEVAVLQSANMSLGINLLKHIVAKAAKLLHNANFDIEIVEKHHNQKIDAPSGTALLLAESVNEAISPPLKYNFDRSTGRAKRGREIGIHAIRGGTIVGEHSVIFAGIDEVIELKHAALSKEVFAAGALSAARYMSGKPPGLYSMQDLVEG